MWPNISGRSWANEHPKFPRDKTITPAKCYEPCNDAYIEAQSAGKTPALCNAGSPFKEYYQACDLCLKQNEGNTAESAARTIYIEPNFFQFVAYCFNLEPTTVVVVTTKATSIPTTLSDGRVSTTAVTSVTTTLILALANSTTASKTITSGIVSSGNSTTTTATASSDNNSSGNSSSGKSSSGNSSSHTPAPTSTDTVTDQRTGANFLILGPVIGAVIAAITILALGVLCFMRKRRRKGQRERAGATGNLCEKAQLHGDCVEIKELHGDTSNSSSSLEKQPPRELCAGSSRVRAEMTGSGELEYAEMVVNEVAAVELSAESKTRQKLPRL